jgi:hypothetical protein
VDQMTPAAWIMLGAAIASPVFTIVWWLVRRPVARIDRLEAAVFGESGVHMRLAKFATTDHLDRKLAELRSAMQGMSEEGQRREDRILQAIQEQTRVVSLQLTETRADVRQQAQRVDALMSQQNGGR